MYLLLVASGMLLLKIKCKHVYIGNLRQIPLRESNLFDLSVYIYIFKYLYNITFMIASTEKLDF